MSDHRGEQPLLRANGHSRLAPLLLLAALLLGAVGCGSRRGEFRSPFDAKAPAPRLETREDLAQLLANRAASHEKFWARGDLVISSDDRRGRDLVTVLLLFREPAEYRLRGSRTPIGTVFDLLLDDHRALLHFTREDIGFLGTPAELREKLVMAGNLMPSDMLSALLAQQELRAMLESGQPVGIVLKKDSMLVAAKDAQGRQHLWNVRRADGLIDEWMLRDARGHALVIATFEEYQLMDVRGRDEPLPWRFRLRVPDSRTTVSVKMDGYKIDPPLTERAFAPPNPKELHPLRALEFAEE